MSVPLLSTFQDPGATAAKPRSLAIIAVTASGVVDTSVVGTFVITYTAVDAGGLQAAPVQRAVTVVDPCASSAAPGRALCRALSSSAVTVCSTCSGGACLCLPPAAASGAAALPVYSPPPYVTPPSIRQAPLLSVRLEYWRPQRSASRAPRRELSNDPLV